MPANIPTSATALPVRGWLAGSDAWELADRAEELMERAALEEAEWQLEVAILRTRRRMQGEQRRAESRRRNRR